MLYSDVKSQFGTILNRRDLTPSQTTTFIGMGIQRILRELRCPAMETSTTYTMDGTGNVPVPGDLLELIDITFNDSIHQRKLVRTDHQTAIRLSNYPGLPTSFYRQVDTFLIGPTPPAGTNALITYYQDASALVADSDHNWLTDATPDLLIYASLSFAADNFLDERADRFEARYQQILDSLNNMASQDELENASISPAYGPNPHELW